jgi:putative ATP-binding cassette transporter
LNDWQGAFFDALQQRDVPAFVSQIIVFLVVVTFLLVLVVAQTWLVEVMKIELRRWLTHDVLDAWLAPQRAYLLGFAGAISENPDQRIQEDIRHLTELTGELWAGLLQATMLLAAFVGVLWMLSSEVTFNWQGTPIVIPGYMVWCAVGFALAGALLTWRVGRPLIALNSEHYQREAELRFSLVRISESADAIALNRGEQSERRGLDGLVETVIDVTYRLAGGLARLTWVTSGYGWLTLIAPVLVAAPGYFAGTLSLGTLMMVINAFVQVQQSLRWYVDNFPRIADWRATLLRVVALRNALNSLGEIKGDHTRIAVERHPDDRIRIDGLRVSLAGYGDGTAVLDGCPVDIEPGERVRIAGPAGAGKTTLFLALAGLWPWGEGRILLPSRADMMFMPQRPYMPLGSLAAALAYPTEPDRYSRRDLISAVEAVGLNRFIPMLDDVERWDRILSLDEQQALAFARMTLHAPKWVIWDDATSALDEDACHHVRTILSGPLAATTVIATGRPEAADGFFTRTICLGASHQPPTCRDAR